MSRRITGNNHGRRTPADREKKKGAYGSPGANFNPTAGEEHPPRSEKHDAANTSAWKDKIPDMPRRITHTDGRRLVMVYVEGYEDVSFWRAIFDEFESDNVTFEISVPPRHDLAKGKKVLLGMQGESSADCLLCVDSDFDYIFGESTGQAKTVNRSPYIFHTYAYATENYLCYAPSLHNVCVRATKNDTRIFDFGEFLSSYSSTIYPLFLWYAFSAMQKNENVFTLLEFKSSVKLNYLEVDANGAGTLKWLERQVGKKLSTLSAKYPHLERHLPDFADTLYDRGVTPNECYMFMQGHTLMDNVVMIMLNAVCEKLKLITNTRISTSSKTGTALRNEISNYNNALRNVRDILLDNEGYKGSPLYQNLRYDIDRYIRSLGTI